MAEIDQSYKELQVAWEKANAAMARANKAVAEHYFDSTIILLEHAAADLLTEYFRLVDRHVKDAPLPWQ